MKYRVHYSKEMTGYVDLWAEDEDRAYEEFYLLDEADLEYWDEGSIDYTEMEVMDD